MKIILSRKGFDSANGGIPSPIFPDGSIFSLPIPVSSSTTQLKDISFREYNISTIVEDLSKNKISGEQLIHLDPDLDKNSLERKCNWKGAFGSGKAAQTHLQNNNVGVGDIFLFFGWFREVEQIKMQWRFKKNAPDLHVIFGWLEVDEYLKVYENQKAILTSYPWLEKHPHIDSINHKKNTIYLGKNNLSLNNEKKGYGVFENVRDIQILTDTSQRNRSLWKLPHYFYPQKGKTALSHHSNISRWSLDNSSTSLQSVAIGQEFVLDLEYYQDVKLWLSKLLS